MTQQDGDLDQYQRIIRKATELYARGAEKGQLIAEIRRDKQTLTEHLFAINRANAVLDAMAAAAAPDVEWRYEMQRGWFTTPKPSMPGASTATHRKQRAIELAQLLVSESRDRTVSTKMIAERLKAEGDLVALPDLATAVGNVLSRAGWRRIRSGEYELAVPPATQWANTASSEVRGARARFRCGLQPPPSLQPSD